MAVIQEIEQRIIWKPQLGPQTALIQCPVFEVFFGGARGGGKTDASIGDWLQHSNTYGKDAIGIFFRRKVVQLAEVIARTKQLFIPLGAKYHEQKKEWVMSTGARLKFAYLERDSDAEEYQGHSYTRVYIEEVTNFPSASPINKLKATLRSGAGVPVGLRLTGNPGGAGHNWVKARYIDPAPEGYVVFQDKETLVKDDGEVQVVSLDRVYIPSRIGDNRILINNDPTYILRLRQSGSEQLVKAWLEGNWDIVDGAFFDEFSEALHVLPSSFANNIPDNALRFRAFDWGSARPFSVGWYALSDGEWGLPKNAIVKYREWYGASGPNKGLKMTADLVARGILERERGERIRYGVADPSIFVRDGGPSIAESMVVVGCSWKRADNKRKAGWEALHQRLLGKEGKPMLYFLENCEDTIRTLPVLQHDESDPEDLDSEAEDHAADELRYAIMSRPWLTRGDVLPVLAFPKLPSEMTISELVANKTKKRLAQESADW